MTTYTILTGEGEMIETGLSLRDAAAEVLTSDSREFDIRSDDGVFTVWIRQQVANSPWTATHFVSFAPAREDAEREIFTDVVNCERMRGHNEAITDEQYRQTLPEVEAGE